MAKDKKETINKQTVIIDDKEFMLEDMTDEQKMILNHIADLDKKINGTKFNLDQLQVGKDAFVNMLKTSLESK